MSKYKHFFSVFTIVACLPHFVVGCCAHHVHAAVSASQVVDHHFSSTGLSESSDFHCCHHVAVSGDYHGEHAPIVPSEEQDDARFVNGQHSDPHPHGNCHEAECSFNLPQRVKTPSCESLAVRAILADADMVRDEVRHRFNQTMPQFPLGAVSSSAARPLLQTWLL